MSCYDWLLSYADNNNAGIDGLEQCELPLLV